MKQKINLTILYILSTILLYLAFWENLDWAQNLQLFYNWSMGLLAVFIYLLISLGYVAAKDKNPFKSFVIKLKENSKKFYQWFFTIDHFTTIGILVANGWFLPAHF